jgi:hypothetical protein
MRRTRAELGLSAPGNAKPQLGESKARAYENARINSGKESIAALGTHSPFAFFSPAGTSACRIGSNQASRCMSHRMKSLSNCQ